AEGRSVRGEVGELVCKGPWPGMTRGIWDDDERYLETYWSRFPGVWTHGDWASVDEDGYWFLHGRSDDTLNIAGKRIGPAELESAAVSHPDVAEAAAIGVPHDVKGEVAWVFCVPRPGAAVGDDLARDVGDVVADELGKAFRPDRVVFVAQLPKTRSAKIVRRAVRAGAPWSATSRARGTSSVGSPRSNTSTCSSTTPASPGPARVSSTSSRTRGGTCSRSTCAASSSVAGRRCRECWSAAAGASSTSR